MGDQAEKAPTPRERRRAAIHDALFVAPTGPWWRRMRNSGGGSVVGGVLMLLLGWALGFGIVSVILGVAWIVAGVLFVLASVWMTRSARRRVQADPPPPDEDPDATS